MATPSKAPNIYDAIATMHPSAGAPPSPAPASTAGEEDDASIIAKLLQVLAKWEETTKNPKVVKNAVKQMSQILNDTNAKVSGSKAPAASPMTPSPAPAAAPPMEAQPVPA